MRKDLVMGLGLAAALVFPLYTLIAGCAWLAIRALTYARAPVVKAEIVDWHQHNDIHTTGTRTFAPNLRFTDRRGMAHEFRSGMTQKIDPELIDVSLLPAGPLNVRYRDVPFFAEVDDPKLWFTLPCLLIATAVLAGMLRYLVYGPLLRLVG